MKINTNRDREYEDNYRHKGAREKLVNQIKEKGITDERVLKAINNIPRHYFVSPEMERFAYEDRALSIGDGQTISQPYTVAFQTQLLKVQPRCKVLEIGTGSIYQATVLAELEAYVYTIERQKNLFQKTDKFILKNKYRGIKFFYGDGFEGLPTYAPFDRIIITAGAPEIPKKLLAQLKPGGIMVIPVNEEGGGQRMLRITKNEDDTFTEEAFEMFSFVPMLKGVEKGDRNL